MVDDTRTFDDFLRFEKNVTFSETIPVIRNHLQVFLVGHCEGSDCDNDGSDFYGNGHDDDASNYNEKDNDNDDENDDGSDGCDTQANVIKSLELSWQSLISDKT